MSHTQVINGNLNVTGSYLLNGSPIYCTGPTDLSAPNFDAFQRLRVSTPFTLFDSSMIYKDNGKFDTYCATPTSTGIFNSNQSSMMLTIGTTGGDQVLRQSYRVFPYQPGKSLQVMCTFVMEPSKPNLIQRVGYFDSRNGVFVEQDGNTTYMVIRSTTTGVTVNTRISQPNWNQDTMEGSGPSYIILDMSKAQIFIADLEWLGVGTVRTGFVIDGRIYYCHYFNHANMDTSTYMTTACLPISYQILNTGTTSSSSSLKQICSTVISEGGYEASSQYRLIGTGLTGTSIAAFPTITPIASFRLMSGRPNAIVIPSEVQLAVTTNSTIQMYLLLNGTLNNSIFTSFSESSNVEINQDSTEVTGGTVLQDAFVLSSNQLKSTFALSSTESFNFQLGCSITGISDTITLAASSQSGTATVLASLGWYELN